MLEKLIARSRSADIYYLDNGLVLKLFYEYVPKESVDEEFEKTLIVNGLTSLSPKAYERITLDNREGIVFENIKGRSITYNMCKNPFKNKYYFNRFHEVQTALNTIESHSLPKVKDNLIKRINKSKLINSSDLENLYDIINQLPDMNYLCHMQYNTNVVFTDGNNFTVSDWMQACRGDKIADVASSIIQFEIAEFPLKNVFARLFMTIARKRFIKGYINICKDTYGKDMDRLNKWILLVGIARASEKLPQGEFDRLTKLVEKTKIDIFKEGK